MTTRHVAPVTRWFLVVVLVGASLTWLPAVNLARAGDLGKLDTSLKLVPKDASFYSSSMRLGEQIEIIAGSRAWAKILEMPSVRDAWDLYEAELDNPENPAAQFEQAMENPAVADLVTLLKDMFTQECFVFGDAQYADFLHLIQEVSNAVQYGPMIVEITGETGGMDSDEIQAAALLHSLVENLDALEFPSTVAGFKITDREVAEKNLKNLEGILAVAQMMAPAMADTVDEVEIDGNEFLVISVDGEMIPWDEVPMEDLEAIESEPGQAEKLVAKIREMTLVIAFGIRDDYLLMASGPTTACLEGLGSGELLIERPELKPLAEYADARLVSVNYVSKALNTAAATSDEDIDALVEMVEEVLPHSELSKDEVAEILRDAKGVAEDVKSLLPEPGAILSFGFMNDRGIEGYSYNWSENLYLDGSKPLTLLEHVDGNPILAAVWRERYAPENYDLVAKWCVLGYRYFEKYALPEMSNRERKEFNQFKELVKDLPGRLDRANRELLIPALAESQGGLVLDAKLNIRKLVRDMPDPGKPMPMVEPAILIGVSDAELLRKACAEYRAVLEELMAALREINPDEVPEFDLPKPKVKETDSGTLYVYQPPKHCGVDKKIAPTVGLSDSVAVVALSRAHAQRLLGSATLAAGGVLGDAGEPRAVAVMFNFAGLIESLRPWVDFAARMAVEENMNVAGDSPEAEEILGQVHTVMDVLKVLRTVTAESQFKDGAMVTHTLTEIQDVD